MLAKTCAISLLSAAQLSLAALSSANLQKNVDVLALDFEFGPVKAAYWTGYPHHRRTPFAVSPDGKSAYLAYLDSSETDVHVQQVDPTDFKPTGTTVTITGAKEAGGLVAQNDGFAVMVNEAMPSGTTNAPPSDTPVPVLYRYTNGEQSWKTWLAGPDVPSSSGFGASPDMNGDLVYSAEAGLYGAYFVVTDYTGSADGHFGDSIEYVNDNGTLQQITGATSTWGCSHNTGIAFEAADAAPFASICAEDQGAIWLNTKTQGMTNNGVKISNENTTNGGSGEPMGGMSGSYSALAQFASTTNYIFAWVSRGAMDLTENTWMGTGYTHSLNRTNPRNVAISFFTDKYTLVGPQATSDVGAASGDSQINWVTKGDNDCSNAHAATFGTDNALVTWEEIENPECDFIAMGCAGQFAGSYFQQVDSTGAKVGEPLVETDTYVAGDMVTTSDGRICWPYVSMTWDLSQPVPYTGSTATTKSMSFACMSLDGSSSNSTAASTSASASSVSAAASSVVSGSAADAAVSSSSSAVVSPAVPTTLATSVRSSSSVQLSASGTITSQAVPPMSSAAATPTPAGDNGDDGDDDECDGSGGDETSSSAVTSAAAVATSSTSSPAITPTSSTAASSSSTGDDGDDDGCDGSGDDEPSVTPVSAVAATPTSAVPLPTFSAPGNGSGAAPTLPSIPTIPSPTSTPSGGSDASAWAEIFEWLTSMISRLEQLIQSQEQ
ncbi:MAG: hypothetical protein M1822_005431 [Bathelium mastoideum]|nr:MAG: hypothetical protein M1822_005431 [Bathelium mastoideum]